MDRKRFERLSGDLDSGFYVNVQFSLAPDKVEPLRTKLTLNEVVYRQFYLKKEAVAA
jgi:small subunit ribosomal protein S6